MISYLEGTLGDVFGNQCVLITAGVGYKVSLPSQTLASLPKKGENLALHTTLLVREDALELYGFKSFEERETFEMLVSLSKVGARTALAILSCFSPNDLRTIVLNEDVLALTRVPGIGKKTAQHIFLELKDKIRNLSIENVMDVRKDVQISLLPGILEGLAGLGYAEQECLPIVRELLQKNPNLDEANALRAVLQALATKK